mmetsp:Transcript_21393/g.70874  ORF Transcript_21393/g.70874 Transcript_21393/m.70874 type:complete len:386 (-) Transcript_21393:1812-2969(-)
MRGPVVDRHVASAHQVPLPKRLPCVAAVGYGEHGGESGKQQRMALILKPQEHGGKDFEHERLGYQVPSVDIKGSVREEESANGTQVEGRRDACSSRALRGQEDNLVYHPLGELVGLDPPTQETHGFAMLQLGASPVNADEHVIDDLLVVEKVDGREVEGALELLFELRCAVFRQPVEDEGHVAIDDDERLRLVCCQVREELQQDFDGFLARHGLVLPSLLRPVRSRLHAEMSDSVHHRVPHDTDEHVQRLRSCLRLHAISAAPLKHSLGKAWNTLQHSPSCEGLDSLLQLRLLAPVLIENRLDELVLDRSVLHVQLAILLYLRVPPQPAGVAAPRILCRPLEGLALQTLHEDVALVELVTVDDQAGDQEDVAKLLVNFEVRRVRR